MKIKTSELIGSALDWAVAVCEGHYVAILTIEEQRQRWMEHINLEETQREQEYWDLCILPTIKPRICVLSADGYKCRPMSHVAPMPFGGGPAEFSYSTNWSQGGPIIEKGGIELLCNLTATEAERFSNSRADWQAFYRYRRSTEDRSYATTPLVAAMRCYVSSKMGDEVEIPEELA